MTNSHANPPAISIPTRKASPLGSAMISSMRGSGTNTAKDVATTTVPADTPKMLTASAKKCILLLTEHIEKEKIVLLPTADRRQAEPKQEELFEAFEKLKV